MSYIFKMSYTFLLKIVSFIDEKYVSWHQASMTMNFLWEIDCPTKTRQPFKRQPHKMVKQTQTIRWQQPTNCLSVFEHFVKLALKGLTRTGGMNKTSLYTSVVTICG